MIKRFKLKKWNGNPILKPTGRGNWEKVAVLNPGAYYDNGKVYLLYRASGEFDDYFIYFGLAVSKDGFHFKRVSKKPVLGPSKNGYDGGCVEDARIVKFGKTYYITYAFRKWAPGPLHRKENPRYPGKTRAERENSTRSGIVTTRDFRKFKRLGAITDPELDDRDVILFPEKINGKYAMFHRPVEWTGKKYGCKTPSMWLAYSDDLLRWKNHKLLIKATKNKWESVKVGGSAPPVKTPYGWLTLYHATDKINAYRAGVMMLDLKDPSKVIARSPYPILEPEAKFEKYGFVNNVVFPVGNVVIKDTLFVYYGGADEVCCVATAKMKDIIDYVMQFKK